MLLDEKIAFLKKQTISMASQNQEDYRLVIKAFLERDGEAAKAIEAKSFNFDVFEEEVFRVLALHQPIASDLKRVINAFKVGQELDMLHSYVRRVAKKTRKISAGDKLNYNSKSLSLQVNVITEMMDDMCRYIQEGDSAGQAYHFKKLESECHQLKKDTLDSIGVEMNDADANVKQLLLVQGISRNLDRIAKIIVAITEE